LHTSRELLAGVVEEEPFRCDHIAELGLARSASADTRHCDATGAIGLDERQRDVGNRYRTHVRRYGDTNAKWLPGRVPEGPKGDWQVVWACQRLPPVFKSAIVDLKNSFVLKSDRGHDQYIDGRDGA
jgi:hypothetical protein